MVTAEAIRVAQATGYHIERPINPTGMERRMIATWTADRTWQIGQCRVCAYPIAQPAPPAAGADAWTRLAAMPVTVCDRCEPLVAAHYSTAVVEEQFGDWHETCPKLFRQLINGELAPHHIDERALAKVLSWKPHTTGMVLVGESGCGKTLALWSLKKQLEAQKVRCDIWTAVEIARELSKHARGLDEAIHLWRVKVLCIDDLGKEPITTAAAALLWELIDRRYGAQVPTIITTRFTGDAFANRFAEPALGSDIRRRIRDACQVVTFHGAAK